MVVSSKKKKGKQRKAAAAAAAANSGSGGSSSSNKIVAKVRSGDNKVTKKLLTAEGMTSLSLISYEHSGVLSIVLDYLKRCENDTFEGVMSSVGGDLKSPILWIRVLIRASYVEPSSKLQIAESIGPLVRCMVNDTKCIFFKSNMHWKEAILKFFNLVENVIRRREEDALENMQIVEAVLQHEGLLRFIIQMGFWREHRPDIVTLLKSERPWINNGITFTGTVSDSRVLMDMLVHEMKGESRIQLLETIGTSPVVNKEYDPTCMTSCVAGLVCQLKDDTLLDTPYMKEGNFTDQRKIVFGVLQRLVNEADCVDKGFITELIDLGTNYTSNYESAINVALLSFSMIHGDSNMNERFPNDTRVACATRVGLIEMCLGFIERFSQHESFGNNNDVVSMYNSSDDVPMNAAVTCIFQSINDVSLHQKTAKAIRSKRSSIEEKLVYLDQNKSIATNPNCKELLDMVRSILDISGSYCCRCNKSLSRTEVMECNGCSRMVYCSRACQRNDWLNGHSLTCCKSYTDETAGQFQGRVQPISAPPSNRAATKLDEHEKNMAMIQLKLFLDNSDAILSRAKELILPLCDCAVVFDLRKCPLEVRIEKYSDMIKEETRIGFEETRSKENITCIFFSTLYYGAVQSGEYKLFQQRLFPHKWLMKQSK